MVEPAADPAAGDDPRGVEHPQPGDEHEHPPRARRRPQRPPRLPRQVLLCHRETAAAGSEDQHKVQRHNQVMSCIPTEIQNICISRFFRLLVGTKLNVHMSPPVIVRIPEYLKN